VDKEESRKKGTSSRFEDGGPRGNEPSRKCGPVELKQGGKGRKRIGETEVPPGITSQTGGGVN